MRWKGRFAPFILNHKLNRMIRRHRLKAIVLELKQYAVMAANSVTRRFREQTLFINDTYERAKSLNNPICPACRVNRAIEIKLKTVAYGETSNIMWCNKCKFSAVLPKQ